MKRRLKPEQQKFWARITGNHNHAIRRQLDYMVKHGTISVEAHERLVDLSYVETELVMWRQIVDCIRGATMRDFNLTFGSGKRRKRHKRTAKKPAK